MEFACYALGALLLLAVAVMAWDVRARWRDRAEWHATFAALGRRVSRHDDGLVTLGRAVALLAPADARPTTAPAHVAAVPGVPRRASPRPPPPAVVAAAPIDDTGDRGGINPGDTIPGDPPAASAVAEVGPDTVDRQREHDELRRHAEAGEDARDAERARRQVPPLLAALSKARQVPTQADVDPDARRTMELVLPRLGDEGDEGDDDERTVVGPRPRLTSDRPTELGGAAAERSKLRRVLPEERVQARRAWAEQTMVSPGMVRAPPATGPGGDPVEGLTQIITPAGLDAGILPPPENDRCALKLVPPPPSDRESPEPA